MYHAISIRPSQSKPCRTVMPFLRLASCLGCRHVRPWTPIWDFLLVTWRNLADRMVLLGTKAKKTKKHSDVICYERVGCFMLCVFLTSCSILIPEYLMTCNPFGPCWVALFHFFCAAQMEPKMRWFLDKLQRLGIFILFDIYTYAIIHIYIISYIYI